MCFTLGMTWDGYNEPRRMPPEWYSRITTGLSRGRYWIAIVAWLLFFAYFMFFHTSYDTGSAYDVGYATPFSERAPRTT